MKKKVRTIVIVIVLLIVVAIRFEWNIYNAQFYSIYLQIADIHTPLELEEVIYKSQLSMELEGTYTFESEEELAMWDDFVSWLNNTVFIKVRSTRGSSYTGEGIFLKFEGVEDKLWITVGKDGTIKLGNYVWIPLGSIDLPVDEAYLLEMKAEME